MEVTGFAIGVVALIGPLACACLSGYQLLKDTEGIGEDASDLQLMIDAQMGSLSIWIKRWVHFDDDNLLNLGANSMLVESSMLNGRLQSGAITTIGEEGCILVVRILAKISKTLADAESLQTKYGIKLSPTNFDEIRPVTTTRSALVTSNSLDSEKKALQLMAAGSPTLASHPSGVGTVTLSNTGTGSHRSWFSRARCLRLCSRKASSYRGPVPRKASIVQHNSQVTEECLTQPPTLTASKDNTAQPSPLQYIETGPDKSNFDPKDALYALQSAKSEILRNLTKVQCLKWVLFDKVKGYALAKDLEDWIHRLFSILPLPRIGTPIKITTERHYTVPSSSPIFTGREDALNLLEKAFFDREAKRKQRRAVLHGLGGAGKTQIALKFCEKHRERFDSVFWVVSSSENTVEESFCEIGSMLRVSGRHIVTAVKHRLSSLSNYNYLLIFDNADNIPVSTLLNFFPGGEHGNILVTSRNPKITQIISDMGKQACMVDKMSEEDAQQLLLRAARLTPEEMANPKSRSTALDIVKKLGYLALAIDQAGAYIASNCALAEYLEIYDRYRPTLLNDREFEGSGYAASVYQTWELSFNAVKEKNYAAAELLMVFGYFHYEEIPREIFEFGSAAFVRASRAANGNGTVQLSPLGELLAECIVRCDTNSQKPDNSYWVPFRFEQAINTLYSYSLIKKNLNKRSPTYTIHPLVHCWIRDRHEADLAQRHMAQDMAIALLQDAMMTGESQGGYALRNRLVSHLDAWVYPYLDQEGGEWNCRHTEEERMGVLEAAGTVYHDVGRLKDAERVKETVLAWRIRHLGPADPDTKRIRVSLGNTYRRMGSLHKAMELDAETLELSKEQGEAHPEALDAMLNLAWTYAEQGNVTAAEDLERQVIALRTQTLGPTHIDTAIARGNYGVSLWRDKMYKEAETELRFALERMLEVYGPEHPSTILAIGNLASTLRGQKRWTEAEELGRKVVDLRLQMLGEKHKDVARGIAQIGVTCLEAGRVKEAKELQLEALEGLLETVGEYHWHTLDTLENLGKVYLTLGEREEAVKVLTQLVERRRVVLGDSHPVTIAEMKMLGNAIGGEEGRKVLEDAEELEGAGSGGAGNEGGAGNGEGYRGGGKGDG
ncbi:hypothetical protein BDZ91DRAFT_766264 [Kalaharituber pfeilii]|nr:hypothetical protein BDZ91DRAFT_766264 [Kalaharituber pfeilii]